MAYDRYETGRERDWRGQEQRRSRDDQRSRNEERGFFERAGDEIASWFGGDEDYERGGEHERMGRDRGWADRNRDRDRYVYGGWGTDSERERSFSREGRGPERGGWDQQRGAGSFRGSTAGGSGGYRPMTGDYGRSQGGAMGAGYDRPQASWAGDDQRSGGWTGRARASDQHYHQWRQRQLDELDRDYDQYCRERQDRFEQDFGSWRQGRQQQRQQLGGIREQMKVVGSDGQEIGHVDKVRGDRIILAKSDSDDNRHHAIDCSMIEAIDGEQVRLTVPGEEAKSRWHDVEGERGLFGRGDTQSDSGEESDLSLERSFSGTYR